MQLRMAQLEIDNSKLLLENHHRPPLVLARAATVDRAVRNGKQRKPTSVNAAAHAMPALLLSPLVLFSSRGSSMSARDQLTAVRRHGF